MEHVENSIWPVRMTKVRVALKWLSTVLKRLANDRLAVKLERLLMKPTLAKLIVLLRHHMRLDHYDRCLWMNHQRW